MEGGIPQRTSQEEIFMHADSATAEGGAEDGEDDERDHQEEEGETVAHRVEGGHVAREHVHRDTVREEREGYVRVRMSPPGSILQAYLPSVLVHSGEEWMFSVVSNMYLISILVFIFTWDRVRFVLSLEELRGNKPQSQICWDNKMAGCLVTRLKYRHSNIDNFSRGSSDFDCRLRQITPPLCQPSPLYLQRQEEEAWV